MSSAKADAAQKTGRDVKGCAVLFDMDHVALNGWELSYDAARKVLKERDIDLTHSLFSRFFTIAGLKSAGSRLLKWSGKSRISDEKLAAELREAIDAAFVKKAAAVRPGVERLLKALRDRGLGLGMLSGLDPVTARQVFDKSGLAGVGARLGLQPGDARESLRGDGWVRLAHGLSVRPAACVALASTAVLCKGAVAAGIRCVGVPDAFTSFQDFGGTDCVFETLDESVAPRILECLDVRR